MMENEAQDMIGEVLKQVAASMSDAVKQYGPDAVEMALMAYRLEAIQQLTKGIFAAAIAAAVIAAYVKFWSWSGSKLDGSHNDEPYYFARHLAGVATVFVSIAFIVSGSPKLLDPSAWLAAFGHPEFRIAIKALEAAGLM